MQVSHCHAIMKNNIYIYNINIGSRRGTQARHLTTNVPKILDLNSSSEQIFSKNCRWVPLTISPIRDFQGNDLPKFIEFSIEKPCCCIWDRHGGRKPKETFVIELSYKSVTSSHEELINIKYFFWYKFCSDSKIPQDKSPCLPPWQLP